MRHPFAIVALLAALGAAVAGPVDGPTSMELRVPASKPGEIGEADFTREFKGGQRAAVIIVGDHRPVVDLEVRVYETSKDSTEEKLVARDGGGKDILGAVWIPARTGSYRIVIRNPSEYKPDTNPYDKCYIAIR
jgi:hypothetical protein